MVPNLRTYDPAPTQYSGTNSDSHGSSDASEVMKMPSKTCSKSSSMENLLTGNNADSRTTIPAETVLESNKKDEWRVDNTSHMQ